MSDFNDDYYNEVDNTFADLRPHAFTEKEDLLQPLPQERGVPLGPSGWVENADADDGEAKVTINADGLTVLDGKISIKDAGGKSVLSAAGFEGSWTEFIETGVYNSYFSQGTEEQITPTETGGGEPTADYLASISEDLPYWVVKFVTSEGRRIELDDAIGGYALKIAGEDAEQFAMYQDVPIPAGQKWDVVFNWRYLATANNSFSVAAFAYFMDENHETISSGSSAGLAHTTDQATFVTERIASIGDIPSNARYVRLYLQFDFTKSDANAGPATVYLNGVRLEPRVNYGTQEFPDGVADLDAESVTTDALVGTVQVYALDSNQNNWNPTLLDSATSLALTGLTANRTITGLAEQTPGRIIYIINQSGFSVILAHESASSSAANRFSCPGAANLTIRTSGAVGLVYAIQRWRVIAP